MAYCPGNHSGWSHLDSQLQLQIRDHIFFGGGGLVDLFPPHSFSPGLCLCCPIETRNSWLWISSRGCLSFPPPANFPWHFQFCSYQNTAFFGNWNSSPTVTRVVRVGGGCSLGAKIATYYIIYGLKTRFISLQKGGLQAQGPLQATV